MVTILIETPTDTGTEWGVSITDHNPKAKDYVACLTRESADKLQQILSNLEEKK